MLLKALFILLAFGVLQNSYAQDAECIGTGEVNLIQNGDFEAPVINGMSASVAETNSELIWQSTSAGAVNFNQEGFSNAPPADRPPTTFDGVTPTGQHADIFGSPGFGEEVLFQEFTTPQCGEATIDLTLSFYHFNSITPGNMNAPLPTMAGVRIVDDQENVVYSADITSSLSSDAWVPFEDTITLNAGATYQLQFFDVSLGNRATHLDAVGLTFTQVPPVGDDDDDDDTGDDDDDTGDDDDDTGDDDDDDMKPKPHKKTCAYFTPYLCKRVRCAKGTGEPVCCGGRQYDNCCMAVCVNGKHPYSCRPGHCPYIPPPPVKPPLVKPYPYVEDKCLKCSLLRTPLVPICCEGRQYPGPCYAEHCGYENLGHCYGGYCQPHYPHVPEPKYHW